MDNTNSNLINGMRQYGVKSLSNSNLLAMMLDADNLSGHDCIERIFEKVGFDNRKFVSIENIDFDTLLEFNMSEMEAARVIAALEIAKRFSDEKAQGEMIFDNTDTVANYYMENSKIVNNSSQMIAALLTNRLALIGEVYLDPGFADENALRDLFKTALNCGAVNIVLLGSHASVDLSISDRDQDIARKVRSAGEQFGIRLMDYIILYDRDYVSMRAEGWL